MRRQILFTFGMFLLSIALASALPPLEYPDFYDITDPDSTYYYYDFESPQWTKTVTRIDAAKSLEAVTFTDGLGRPIQTQTRQQDNSFLAVSVMYDEAGNRKRESEQYRGAGVFGAYEAPNWATVRYREYEYDPLGRVKKTANYDGTYTLTHYGPDAVKEIDENSNYVTRTSDAYGRPLDIENALQAHTAYNYLDPLGIRTDVTNAESQLTRSIQDSLGRTRIAEHPDSGVRRNLGYDRTGNLLMRGDGCTVDWSNPQYGGAYTCARGIAYTYDGLNRLKKIDYNADGTYEATFSYDTYTGTQCATPANPAFNYPVGKLVGVSDSYKKSPAYTACYYYDIKGRMRQERRTISGTAYDLSYDYDGIGNLARQTYPNGEYSRYAYDTLNRLQSVTLNDVTQLVSYEYNDDGTLRDQMYGTGVLASFGYTPRKWVEDITVTGFYQVPPGSTGQVQKMFKEIYQYDPAGNLLSLEEYDNTTTPNAGVRKRTGFSYDDIYRLTSAYPVDLGTGGLGTGRYYQKLDYSYDLIGNMLSMNNVQFTVDTASSKLEEATMSASPGPGITTAYAYDAYGNMQAESGWREVDVQGAAVAEDGSYQVWLYGVDASPGDTINVIYYANDPKLSAYAGPQAWSNVLVESYSPLLDNTVPTFLASYDASVLGDLPSGSPVPVENTGTSLAPGVPQMPVTRKGVLIDSSTDVLTYGVPGNINWNQGSLEFWVKPNWDPSPANPNVYILFDMDDSLNGNYFKIGRYYHTSLPPYSKGYIYFATGDLTGTKCTEVNSADAQATVREPGVSQGWQQGSWHRIRVTWKHTPTTELALYVDGELIQQKSRSAPCLAGSLPQAFRVGHVYDSSGVAPNHVIDELRIMTKAGDYRGPYWDTTAADKYKTVAKLQIPSLPVDANIEPVLQYFHAYKEETRNYCFDYANRLVYWWETNPGTPGTATNCMRFSYDSQGTRIQKIEPQSGGQGLVTNYITQGNNVIFENRYTQAFSCTTVCP